MQRLPSLLPASPFEAGGGDGGRGGGVGGGGVSVQIVAEVRCN